MADGDMKDVNEWYEKFGGNDITKVQKTIRNAVSHSQLENAAFIVLAHEYAANPADKKFLGFMYQFFNEAGKYQINIGAENLKVLSTMLNDPEIRVRMGTTKVAIHLGDDAKVKGGFKMGAAANYNLAIKALDFAGHKLVGDLKDYMEPFLKGPGHLTEGQVRGDMVEAYNVLVPFWGDSDLTKFGFTQR